MIENGLSQEFLNQFVQMSMKITRRREYVFHLGDRKKLYVHIPVGLEEIAKSGKLCKPTQEQVFDVLCTKEYWIKKKVKLKCIGRISIGYKTKLFDTKFSFKWLEKY